MPKKRKILVRYTQRGKVVTRYKDMPIPKSLTEEKGFAFSLSNKYTPWYDNKERANICPYCGSVTRSYPIIFSNSKHNYVVNRCGVCKTYFDVGM